MVNHRYFQPNKKMMFTSRAKIELFDTDTFDTKI